MDWKLKKALRKKRYITKKKNTCQFKTYASYFFFDQGLHSGSLSRTLTSKTYDSTCQYSMIAPTVGTWAPLHRSPLQHSTSHLVIFPAGENFLQFFSLHSDEVAHPLTKTSPVTPELSALISALPQRSWLSKQVTSFVLFLQSSQLLREKHSLHFRA